MATLFHSSSSEVCVRLRQSSGKVSALLKDLNHPTEERFTLTSRTWKVVNKNTETEAHSSSLKARTNGPLHLEACARPRPCRLGRKSPCRIICFGLSIWMMFISFLSFELLIPLLSVLSAELKWSTFYHLSAPKYNLTRSVWLNKRLALALTWRY